MIINSKPSPICRICGAAALYKNYGEVTCFACKMFFKRYAEKPPIHFKCAANGDCQINIETRHLCSACRLKKCFDNGMLIELIRCPIPKSHQTKRSTLTVTIQGPTYSHYSRITPVGLLEDDRSSLSSAQWTLLSNLIHCYDEHSGLSLTERYAREQRTLPLKARFKSDSVCLLISSVFGQAQVLFERNLDFLSLCSHDRSLLLHRQMKYASIISSTFITRESGLLDQPGYYQTSEQLFGVETLAMGRRTLTLLDVDIPFLKLALALISFSTFDLTIYEESPADVLLDTRRVVRIEDIYIDLAWRYLVHVYDQRRAVLCFSNLIRCLFNINGLISTTQEKRTFNKMMDTIVDQTETCLTLNH